MTPAEVIVAALREHQHTRYGWLSGKEAAEHAEVALGALAEAGMVVVSAEDVKGAIEVLEAVNNPWASLSEEPELEARLRAALPERTEP